MLVGLLLLAPASLKSPREPVREGRTRPHSARARSGGVSPSRPGTGTGHRGQGHKPVVPSTAAHRLAPRSQPIVASAECSVIASAHAVMAARLDADADSRPLLTPGPSPDRQLSGVLATWASELCEPSCSNSMSPVPFRTLACATSHSSYSNPFGIRTWIA